VNPEELLALAQAIGDAVDVEVAHHPDVNTMELCGILGGLAGVVLGQAMPQAAADVDQGHLEAVVGSFRAALIEAREKRRPAN
jgi:hypothetical protein